MDLFGTWTSKGIYIIFNWKLWFSLYIAFQNSIIMFRIKSPKMFRNLMNRKQMIPKKSWGTLEFKVKEAAPFTSQIIV